MKSNIRIAMAFCYLSGASIIYGAEYTMSPAVREKVDIAISTASDVSWPAKNPQAFMGALQDLDRAADAEVLKYAASHEGDEIDAKLVAIARHLREHPDLYQSILSYYVQNAVANSLQNRAVPGELNIAPKVDLTPALQPEHLTEEYRLPWEFCLLIKWIPGAPEDFEDKCLQALVKIGNQNSASALASRYRRAAVDPRSNPQSLNRAFVQLPGDKILRTLLQSVEYWENNNTKRRQNAAELPNPGLEEKVDVRSAVFEAFQELYDEAPEKIADWRAVFQTFQQSGLSNQQAALLRSIQHIVQRPEN